MAPTSTPPGLLPGDQAHLERARVLARGGWGRVHPNPMVGCVLVRDGEVVGEGHHAEYGGPHAEVVALESARSRALGAAAYVSLEPCDHHGKTPPCTQALIQAGVRRVVFGAQDPGPVSGGGAATLRSAGIEVVGPVWDDATARSENPAFFHAARHSSPWIAVKLAQTLDGFIAEAPGRRTRITGAEADARSHQLRTGFDALLVGAGTLRADDPLLTVRNAPQGRLPPARMVLDPRAEMPTRAAVLRDAASVPVHVFTRRDARESELERLEAAGARVHPLPYDGRGLSLEALLSVAWGVGIRSVLCEGGARLASELLRDGTARRLYLWVAPFTLPSPGVPAFPGVGREVWGRFRPATAPEFHGRDTLLVLDREED
ncbi:MAG TPA: bifunctional diaminohydroxyphosphoribosylaminopyrimidine deaminase/5-amino-6-(5-phosphoribosylamino)uracil reductase RibD [Longimicrobiales bacterium]|nr:bifunctional diaminohydroxyphosphoribosylaminopyrimidine deaminase/5-amino-6-(5-phosphoribosylamino)uracil reductase RibD [Longimicrobiales bacterium]